MTILARCCDVCGRGGLTANHYILIGALAAWGVLSVIRSVAMAGAVRKAIDGFTQREGPDAR